MASAAAALTRSIIFSTITSMASSDESRSIASGACTSGALARRVAPVALLRLEHRLETPRLPCHASPPARRTGARTSMEAVRKNLALALGSTTVPMSRPSSTAPGGLLARVRKPQARSPLATTRSCSTCRRFRACGSRSDVLTRQERLVDVAIEVEAHIKPLTPQASSASSPIPAKAVSDAAVERTRVDEHVDAARPERRFARGGSRRLRR